MYTKNFKNAWQVRKYAIYSKKVRLYLCVGGDNVYIAKREELKRRRIAAGLNKKELSQKTGLPGNAIGGI